MWLVTMVFGATLMALAVNLFLLPLRLAEGGLVGISIILHHLLQVPPWASYALMNVPIALLAVRARGWAFLGKTALGVGTFSVAMFLTADMAPVTTNPLLGIVYGGLALGTGLGLVLRSGATTGGVDVLAILLHRPLGVTVGTVLMAFDALVIIGAGLAFRSVETAMFSAITLMISSRTVDYIQEGFYGAKGVSIITARPEPVARRILAELERGCTIIPGQGAYTGQPLAVVYSVVQRGELTALKRIVAAEDEKAFMAISDVREALGEGFLEWHPGRPPRPTRSGS